MGQGQAGRRPGNAFARSGQRSKLIQVVWMVCALVCLRPQRPSTEQHECFTPSSRQSSPGQLSSHRLHSVAVREATAAAKAQPIRPGPRSRGASKLESTGVFYGKIKMFMKTPEYRDMVDLLTRLEEEGALGDFLVRATRYWNGIRLLDLGQMESRGSDYMYRYFQQDWPKVWPEGLESSRVDSWARFRRFLQRLISTGLIDNLLREVIPDINKELEDPTRKDTYFLRELNETEVEIEFFNRCLKCSLAKDYMVLSKDDADVQRLVPKLGPVLASMVCQFEYKLFRGAAELGTTANVGFFAFMIGLAFLVVTFGLGVFPNPFIQYEEDSIKSLTAESEANGEKIANEFKAALKEAKEAKEAGSSQS